MDLTSVLDLSGVLSPPITEMPSRESFDVDFTVVDTFLSEYSPAELLKGFDLSPRPAATCTDSSDCAQTSVEQSSNDSDSDSNGDWTENNKYAIRRRMCRKDEILSLRSDVQRLRAEYTTLRYRTKRGGARGISSQTQKLWAQLAQSQLERRRKYEDENLRLQEMVAIQVLEAKNLRRILKRRTRIEMMNEMLGSRGLAKLVKYPPQDESMVFQRLLHEADELFVGIDSLFASKGMDTLAFAGHSRATDLEILNGVYYEMLQKRELPFDRQSTAKAVWECFRNLGEANLRGVGGSNAVLNTHPHIIEDDGDTLRRSFFAVISGVGDFEGTYTQKVARRYRGSNRSVFIARLISKPQFRGNTRGSSATTSMQVVLEDGVDDVSTTVMKVYFSAERAGKAAKEDPATEMAFAAWDELVPRFPADVETSALDNICRRSASAPMALV